MIVHVTETVYLNNDLGSHCCNSVLGKPSAQRDCLVHRKHLADKTDVPERTNNIV